MHTGSLVSVSLCLDPQPADPYTLYLDQALSYWNSLEQAFKWKINFCIRATGVERKPKTFIMWLDIMHNYNIHGSQPCKNLCQAGLLMRCLTVVNLLKLLLFGHDSAHVSEPHKAALMALFI